MEERITLKGSRDGLRLILHQDAPWNEVLAALRAQLAQGNSFYQGAKLLIDIGERTTSDTALQELLAVMAEFGIEPEALITAAPTNRAAGRGAGLAPRHPETLRSYALPANPGEGLFVWRTVRSGQEIRHGGHVVVFGDVNAGAEVVAAGSVLIWGRLRGTVHAGASGDAAAIVCALELRPTLLRIADQLSRTPDNHRPAGPEQASLDSGQIIVVPWDAPRR
jgi:septum site-determining protein MinC